MSIALPAGYEWILFIAAVMALECVVAAFSIHAIRGRLFTKAFFDTHFPNLKDAHQGEGFPDTGNGRYSDKLSFEDWYTFNCWQRTHQNFVEDFAPALVGLLVSGLVYTRFATVLGFTYATGRALYIVGYRVGGPMRRLPGAILHNLSRFALIGTAIFAMFNAGGGIVGLTKALGL